MEEQLRREPWYHGKMNRKEAEKLLKVNGDFLVRESTTTPGQYVLTGLQGGQPKHLLLVDPEGVVSPCNPKVPGVPHPLRFTGAPRALGFPLPLGGGHLGAGFGGWSGHSNARGARGFVLLGAAAVF